MAKFAAAYLAATRAQEAEKGSVAGSDTDNGSDSLIAKGAGHWSGRADGGGIGRLGQRWRSSCWGRHKEVLHVWGIPALAAGYCQVWSAAAVAPERLDLLALLDAGERERLRHLRLPKDQALYLTAHALARILAGFHGGLPPAQVQYIHRCRRCGDWHGKPQVTNTIPPVELSWSHAGSRAVVAIALEQAIGVDLEFLTGMSGGGSFSAVALDASEQAVLDRLPEWQQPAAFLRYWTRKEAALKATGDGLNISPSLLRVSSPEAPASLLEWRAFPAPRQLLHLNDLEIAANYVSCLATLGDPLRAVVYDANPLLT